MSGAFLSPAWTWSTLIPTYRYRCTRCLAECDQAQPFTAAALTVCPTCTASTLERVMSGGAFFMVKGASMVNGEQRFRTEFVGRERDGSETVYRSQAEAYAGELERAAASVHDPWSQRKLAETNVKHMRRYQGLMPGTKAAAQATAIEERAMAD